jgi:hypothetical protein
MSELNFLLGCPVTGNHITSYQINKEVNRAAMTGMLDLRTIFQWIMDGFND